MKKETLNIWMRVFICLELKVIFGTIRKNLLGKMNSECFAFRKKKFIKGMADLGSVAIILCMLFLYSFSTKHEKDFSSLQDINCPDSCIICVNDLCISRDEFMLHFNKNISLTTNYFYQNYKAQIDNDFWEKSFEGEVPIDYIKEKTIDRIVQIKIVHQLAVEHGLLKPFTYYDIVKWWNMHNGERKKKLEKGGVIYGPVQDSFDNYYEYFYLNLGIKLKDYLNQSLFNVSDSILKEYYENIKQEYFSYTPSVEVEYIEYPYDASMDITAIQDTMERLKEIALEDDSLKSAIGIVPKTYYQQASYSDTISIIGEDNPDHERKMFATQLSPDEVKVFHSKEHRTFYLMKCLSRDQDEIYSFEKVKKDVIWYYQKKQYDDLIDSLKQKTVVSFNQSEFDKIKMVD